MFRITIEGEPYPDQEDLLGGDFDYLLDRAQPCQERWLKRFKLHIAGNRIQPTDELRQLWKEHNIEARK